MITSMTAPANRDAFIAMLRALGEKDYDGFERHLDPDLVCEWPYVVMEGFPTRMTGARRLRDALEVSWVKFTPYSYQIQHLHDLDGSGQADRRVQLAQHLPAAQRSVREPVHCRAQVRAWSDHVLARVRQPAGDAPGARTRCALGRKPGRGLSAALSAAGTRRR